MKPYKRLLLIMLLSLALGACSSSKHLKNMVYFNDPLKQDQQVIAINEEAKIQAGDRLEIVVTALNPQAALVYNMLPVTQEAGAAMGTPAKGGYLVDESGNIQFPQLGAITVKDSTRLQVAEKLKLELAKYITGPSVSVNIVNFKVSVLGEVNKPGTVIAADGKLTILEALGESGDLTVYGKRENILVIREKNGRREFGRIDLTKNEVFTSSYYNLKQGDVIYVEMKKNKLMLSDAQANNNFRVASLILAGITAIAVLINVLK